METAYLICAIVGGTLIVCQFLLLLFGLGGDHDAGGHDGGGGAGHDVAGHDAGQDAGHDAHHHGHGSNWFFGWLTFRTATAGAAFFGLVGLAATHAEVEPGRALLMALAAGAGAIALVGWLMRQMSRLNVDGTARLERAVGRPGVVYLSIPGHQNGAGKVHVSVSERTLEVKAVTDGTPLPTGTPVVVVALVGRDTVLVARTPS